MLKNLVNKKKLQEGFTIIEVMIVLAIAGLILVVVLVAIPQLQRNQRNNARQSILARITTEISNYAGNNNGTIPVAAAANTAGNFGALGNANTFAQKYLGNVNINDPSTGSAVSFVFAAAEPAQGVVSYNTATECGLDGAIVAVAGQNRKFSMRIGLEGGRAYCLDNK